MQILKLVISFVFLSAIYAQRFLQDNTTTIKIVKIEERKIKSCIVKKDCDDLAPKAYACVWKPKATEGLCNWLDEKGVLRNDFNN
jgi:hypothetical protein